MENRKLIALFFICFLFFSVFSFSQDLDKKITIVVKNQPLGEVIRKIGEEGKIFFSYNPQSLPLDRKITLKARDISIREILDLALKKNGINYFVLENQVVLKAVHDETAGKPAEPNRPAAKHTISGYLKDKATGEVLIGANVYTRENHSGTTTNGYGFYSLTLPAKTYQVVYSYVGYKDYVKTIDLQQDEEAIVEMEGTSLPIREVEIQAKNRKEEIQKSSLSEFRFSAKTLSQLPGFAGDLDIIKSLQAVPGIKSYGDGSGLFYVRGGNSDQNLILIDEAPIYNPSHLFGFFSVLAPDAINEMTVFKGDFPARYGGRLSSVIDIKAKNGNLKRFGFSGNIGPYASELTLEGPIVKDRSSFIISGRVSTMNWLNNLHLYSNSFSVLFYDVNAKVNFKANNNNRFYLTFFYGYDHLGQVNESSYPTSGMSWNNMAGTFRWNHAFSNKLFSNTTLCYSRYHYYLYIDNEQKDVWNSAISNLTLKTDFGWYLNPKNTIRAGFEVTSHNSDPGNVSLPNNQSDPNVIPIPLYHSMEYDFYVGNDQKVGKRIILNYGIRLPVWQDIGPTTVYHFDAYHNLIDSSVVSNMTTYAVFFSPEPRLNIRFILNERSSLKASYSRTTQFLQVLSNSVSPFTSLEVWAPCGPNIKPQKADQVSLGYYLQVPKTTLNFSAELFYTLFHDHIDYANHANLLFNRLLEGEVRNGQARAYGLELMVRKPEGKFTGWIGYTYSRTFVKTPEINDSQEYPAFYDRPHNVCIYLAWVPGKHWELSANWLYLTGGAITTPVGFFYNNGYSVPVYGDRNNDRLPDYHRLDIAVKWKISRPEQRYQHSLILTLYNAYGHMNPFSVNFNKTVDGNGNIVVPANMSGSAVLVPTTISVAGIIPSINYQFKF
ncbi:MAG: TonB-dependent receptor [Bacteroidetes bacterium]|nr:TonB-dependent receptor [Bacteroidota bacterium]